MCDLFSVKLGIVQSSLIEAYRQCIINGPEENPDGEKYKALAKKLNDIENDYEAEMAAVDELEADGLALSDFDEVYKLTLEKVASTKTSTKRRDDILTDMGDIYAQFGGISAQQTEMSTTIANVDDMEIEEEISTVDPLTKQQITHPVRNRYCKHIYDKNSVEAQLEINPVLRCPIIGCSNKVKVLMSDLVEDRELKRKMISLVRRNKTVIEDSD